MTDPKRGLTIAAPSSGAGKTTVTLGLLRALRDRNVSVASAKSGPDFIDPLFHEAATGRRGVTLDPWCADAAQLRSRAARTDAGFFVVEGAAGLFDGAPSSGDPLGQGSTADVASALGTPVILVVDAARRAQTTAAVVQGLNGFRPDVRIAGVVLNRVDSAEHEAMLRSAVGTVAPVLGALPRDSSLSVPSRHLGLKQAAEVDDLEALIAALAEAVAQHCDLDAILAAADVVISPDGPPRPLPPPGQRIAVALDQAFGFVFPHLLDDWRAAGAEVTPFSPLSNESPAAEADAVFLPGGFPELYGGRLSAAARFWAGMHDAARRGALIYGEGGGFAVLGAALIDGYARHHPMLGLLDLEVGFADRSWSRGHRRLQPLSGAPWAGPLLAYEDRYSTATRAVGEPLFRASDTMGADLGPIGLRSGRVMGSLAHIVEPGPA